MNKSAHIAGICFSMIFGFSFMFSKIALQTLEPMGLIAYRFLLAFIVFEALRLTGVVKIRFQIRFILPLFLVVFFQPILYFVFETYGLTKITSSEAGMMIALIPIVVSILSAVILKEKPKLVQIFFIILSVSGIIVIQLFKADFGLEGNFFGILLLFFAVLSAALFNIASRNASKILKPYELTYFMMLSGAIVFNIIYLIQLGFSNSLSDYFTSLANVDVILSISYLGIVASICGFFLVNFAIGKMPAHVGSVYANLATVVAVLAGAVFLKESLEWYHYLGGVMIILGVYGTARVNYLSSKNKALFDNQNTEVTK